MSSSTVYIIDDDVELTASLRVLLESMNYNVLSYQNVADFLALDKLIHPCCLLIDIRMPGTSGLELQDILVSKFENTPIIFMSGFGDISTAIRAIKAGAIEFLIKPINNQVLLECINKAVSLDIKQQKLKNEQDIINTLFTKLTTREFGIVKLLVVNLSNKEIAEQLGISPKTVDLHRANIMKKMDVKNIVGLVNLAWCAGIIDVETVINAQNDAA